MTKQEVFNLLNSGVDKSGYLQKEIGFKETFPELYNEFLNTQFPPEIDVLPFKQKLWHFLKEDYVIPVCKICNKPTKFINGWKYATYCSHKCAMKNDEWKEKAKQTCIERYGVKHYRYTNDYIEKCKQTCLDKYGYEFYFQTNEFKEKSKETCLEKYGVESYLQTSECKEKAKQIYLEKYGVEHYVQSDEYKKRYKQTCLEKYGVNNYSQSNEFQKDIKDIQKKIYDTKKQNNSFSKSTIEEQLNDYFISNNIKFIRQYKSQLYPFSCDFYLPNYNLYIEIQGIWTHGGHPFNENNNDDIQQLQLWKSKNTKYYTSAIYTWTIRDVEKRKIAKQNNLNYIEIFSTDINYCIEQIKQKMESV